MTPPADGAPLAGAVRPDRRGRLRMTVRTRVLTAVLLLTALGMAVAGLATYQIQLQRMESRLLDDLTIGIEEFRTLAREGVDPDTGMPFESPCPLIYTAMQRMSLAPHEGMLGLVDGALWRTAPVTVVMRLEQDPELVRAVTGQPDDDPVRVRQLTTDITTYQYVAVPVAGAVDASAPAPTADDPTALTCTSPSTVTTGTRQSADPDLPTPPADAATGTFVLAVDWGQEHDDLAGEYRTFAGWALASLVLVGVVGWVVAGRSLRPVRELGTTAQHINESDLSERIPVRGNDDLSDIARTVNAMLDRLEVSFGSQRRLLDDVGHELRTPLTIVRGHLELMDPADPDEVAATRALALDEVDRMHRLVDDLVTLATADRPDFVLPRPTEVAALTDDVADKARTLGDRRWVVADRADVEMALDPQRITQAWLQLAANAVKFSAPGSTVQLGSSVVRAPHVGSGSTVGSSGAVGSGSAVGSGDDGGAAHVLLWVTDEGEGVAPADRERIFDRFARGAEGRRTEGAGLGLPIVAAITAAHGGRVDLDSTPGAGATFSMVLPLGWAPEPAAGTGVGGGGPQDGTSRMDDTERIETLPLDDTAQLDAVRPDDTAQLDAVRPDDTIRPDLSGDSPTQEIPLPGSPDDSVANDSPPDDEPPDSPTQAGTR